MDLQDCDVFFNNFFLLETLQMNSLSEMGMDYIDTEKEDSSQLSAQEAVVKSAKLGKKGQPIVQVQLQLHYLYFLAWK